MVAIASDIPTTVLALFIVTALSILLYYLFWKVSLHVIATLAYYNYLCWAYLPNLFPLCLPPTDMRIQRTHHNIELLCRNTDGTVCYSSIALF